MKLLTQNSKLKKTSKLEKASVYNFGITAVKACPSALHCVADCYARQGAYRWSNVSQAFDARYELTKTNDFVAAMVKEISSKRSITHVRIHDSGDFYSEDYLNKWLKIICQFPEITFYAYTKEVKLFKKYALPSNFTVIFSYGGKHDALIDKNKDRYAQVFDVNEKVPEKYINASDNDLMAITKNKNVALIYHGQKKMSGFNSTKAKRSL